jgi:ribosomal protein S18 acetylase RimI-like enzyme
MLQQPGVAAEIAWVDAARVGFFILGFDALRAPFGPWKRPVASRLDAIAVVPGVQRHGVGRALLERAQRAARERGAVVMSLMTATENLAAQRLFERSGFLALTELPERYANGDGGIEMFKALDLGEERER